MTYQQIPKRTQEKVQIPQTTSQSASRPFTPIAKQTTLTPNQQLEQTEGLLPRNTNFLAIPGLTAMPKTKVSQVIQGEPTIGQPGDNAVQAESNVEQEIWSPAMQIPKILGNKKITGSRKPPFFKIKSSIEFFEVSEPEGTVEQLEQEWQALEAQNRHSQEERDARALARATPLADDEFILSMGTEIFDSIQDICNIIPRLMNVINFDPSSVQYKAILLGTKKELAITLKWNSIWGSKPTSKNISSSWRQIIQAKGSLLWLHNRAGWRKLDSSEQTILESLLGSPTNNLSNTVRENVSKLFINDLDPTLEADKLRSFITDKDIKPYNAQEPVTIGKVGYSFTTPEPITKTEFQFHDVIADAEIYVLEFDDSIDDSERYSLDYREPPNTDTNIHNDHGTLTEKIMIVAEKKTNEPESPNRSIPEGSFIPGTDTDTIDTRNFSYFNNTVKEIADALSNLPRENRLLINGVILDPVPRSSDYKLKKGFETDMTANIASGNVHIFAKEGGRRRDEKFIPITLLHESGHLWSLQCWGTDKSKGKWLEWKKMMDADKISVSGYAMKNIDEDFAETFAIYAGTKNSPAFEEYRQIVPKRFAMIDKEYWAEEQDA